MLLSCLIKKKCTYTDREQNNHIVFDYSTYLCACRDYDCDSAGKHRETFESDSSSSHAKPKPVFSPVRSPWPPQIVWELLHLNGVTQGLIFLVCVTTGVIWDGQETVATSERNPPSPHLHPNHRTHRWVTKKHTCSLASVKMSVITGSLHTLLISLQFLCSLAPGCCCFYLELLRVFWLYARKNAP